MKLRYVQYRALIVLGVYLVAFLIFYGTINNHVHISEFRKVNSVDATLPVVSFVTSDAEINRTLGYTFIPQEGKMRQSITPVMQGETSIIVLVDQKGTNVRKMSCSVTEITTGLVMDDINLMSLKDYRDGRIYGQFFFTAKYATNTEYLMRITLTTGEGKDVYYYTRLMFPTFGNPKQEVEFLENFHSAILDDERQTEIEKYLETEDSYTGADFSRITHRDSVDSVGYGQMEPKEIESYVPTFVEYTSSYVAAEKDFYVEAYSNDGLETYSCVEHYRFRTTSKTNYLYSFERKMEVMFEPVYFNLSARQIKLGITGEQNLNCLMSENNKYLMFSRDGDLWEYDMKENVMIPLFSFDREGGDFERYHNTEHNFKLISVDNDGNADFVFYGYIVRGEYEGRVGIIYYRYYAEEKRVEEMMFTPVTVPYDILKEEFGDVCYMNSFNEFYFTLDGTLYQYRSTLHDYTVVVENMVEPFYFEGSKLVYQETTNEKNTKICYHDLESNTIEYREAAPGDRLLFLGSIDGDFIYGDAHASDVTFKDNGQSHVPMYRIRIETSEGKPVKEYVRERDDEYFLDATIHNNGISILINRKKEVFTGTRKNGTTYNRPIYTEVGTYNILKSSETPKDDVTVSSKYTEPMRREYYLNLPDNQKISKVPQKIEIDSTQNSVRTTAKLINRTKNNYYVQAFGKVIAESDDLAYCVSLANANYGSVFEETGLVIWVRGMRGNSALLHNVTPCYCNGDLISEKEAVLQMFFSYKGSVTKAADCDLNERAMLDWLTENIPGTAVDLTGVTMLEALSFTSEGHLVATVFEGKWLVITGYTANLVYAISPSEGKTKTIALSRMRDALDNVGLFYTYVD